MFILDENQQQHLLVILNEINRMIQDYHREVQQQQVDGRPRPPLQSSQQPTLSPSLTSSSSAAAVAAAAALTTGLGIDESTIGQLGSIAAIAAAAAVSSNSSPISTKSMKNKTNNNNFLSKLNRNSIGTTGNLKHLSTITTATTNAAPGETSTTIGQSNLATSSSMYEIINGLNQLNRQYLAQFILNTNHFFNTFFKYSYNHGFYDTSSANPDPSVNCPKAKSVINWLAKFYNKLLFEHFNFDLIFRDSNFPQPQQNSGPGNIGTDGGGGGGQTTIHKQTHSPSNGSAKQLQQRLNCLNNGIGQNSKLSQVLDGGGTLVDSSAQDGGVGGGEVAVADAELQLLSRINNMIQQQQQPEQILTNNANSSNPNSANSNHHQQQQQLHYQLTSESSSQHQLQQLAGSNPGNNGSNNLLQQQQQQQQQLSYHQQQQQLSIQQQLLEQQKTKEQSDQLNQQFGNGSGGGGTAAAAAAASASTANDQQTTIVYEIIFLILLIVTLMYKLRYMFPSLSQRFELSWKYFVNFEREVDTSFLHENFLDFLQNELTQQRLANKQRTDQLKLEVIQLEKIGKTLTICKQQQGSDEEDCDDCEDDDCEDVQCGVTNNGTNEIFQQFQPKSSMGNTTYQHHSHHHNNSSMKSSNLPSNISPSSSSSLSISPQTPLQPLLNTTAASASNAVTSMMVVDPKLSTKQSTPSGGGSGAGGAGLPCSVCGKVFRNTYKLNRHLYVHKDPSEKPLMCDWEGCTYRSISNNDLSRHRMIHTGEKPYLCNILGCDKRYSRADKLRYHKQTVHFKDLFKKHLICLHPACNFQCSTKLELARHQCEHNAAQAVASANSGSGVNLQQQQLHLQQQQQQQQQAWPHKCDIIGCNRTFQRPDRLKKHKEKDHNQVPPQPSMSHSMSQPQGPLHPGQHLQLSNQQHLQAQLLQQQQQQQQQQSHALLQPVSPSGAMLVQYGNSANSENHLQSSQQLLQHHNIASVIASSQSQVSSSISQQQQQQQLINNSLGIDPGPSLVSQQQHTQQQQHALLNMVDPVRLSSLIVGRNSGSISQPNQVNNNNNNSSNTVPSPISTSNVHSPGNGNGGGNSVVNPNQNVIINSRSPVASSISAINSVTISSSSSSSVLASVSSIQQQQQSSNNNPQQQQQQPSARNLGSIPVWSS